MLATFLPDDEFASLTTFLAQKNIPTTETFWFGIVALDDGTSTFWSQKLSAGITASFLVKKWEGVSGNSSVHEASGAHAYPFICRGKTATSKEHSVQAIFPTGFETVFQLEHRVASYMIVEHSITKAKVILPNRRLLSHASNVLCHHQGRMGMGVQGSNGPPWRWTINLSYKMIGQRRKIQFLNITTLMKLAEQALINNAILVY